MILGILGGIGSGKSTVTRMLVEEGARALFADEIAHAVLETEPVRASLREWWGDEVFRPDGAVDRGAVAQRVFESKEQLERLESVVHPEVRRRIEDQVRSFRARPDADARLLVLDVPLLAESPLRHLCDSILFVEAEHDVRLERVSARGWSADELERRERQQTDLDAKRRLADRTIHNGGELEATRARARALYRDLTSAAADGSASSGLEKGDDEPLKN